MHSKARLVFSRTRYIHPAVIATVLTASVLFGCAIAVIESDLQTEPSIRRTALKVGRTFARNPLLLAPAAGALFAASGLSVPLAVASFAKLLGGAATPCALIALGFFVAERNVGYEPIMIGRLVVLNPGRPVIATGLREGMGQNVRPTNLVVEQVEAEGRRRLPG